MWDVIKINRHDNSEKKIKSDSITLLYGFQSHGPHALQQSSSESIFRIFPQCQLQVSRTVPLAAESLQLIA